MKRRVSAWKATDGRKRKCPSLSRAAESATTVASKKRTPTYTLQDILNAKYLGRLQKNLLDLSDDKTAVSLSRKEGREREVRPS